MLDELIFPLTVAAVGFAAGAVASIAGFGIGSLLTPLLIPAVGAKLAVALVAVPHAIATAVRLSRLSSDIAWPVMKGFGLASAAGGLMGALLFTQAGGDLLARFLGVLLVVVGSLELAGIARRLRVSGRWGWAAGAVSGLFGGMVGNQGGVRSAALLGFELTPKAYVATAAAIALVVDVVRLPVYLWTEGAGMLDSAALIGVATIGVIAGTFVGTGLLLRLPKAVFRRAVGAVLIGLGIWMFR